LPLLFKSLEKVSQSEWFGASTMLSLSLLEELGIVQIKNQGDF